MLEIKRIPIGKEEAKTQKDIKSVQGTPKPITITPEYVVGKLFSFHNTAHYYHFQTNRASTHDVLHTLYDKLVHFKDEIPEYFLGMQAPKRFDYINLDEIKPYSDTSLLDFLEEGIFFGKSLGNYAELKEYHALESMASHVCKSFTRAKLMITYK